MEGTGDRRRSFPQRQRAPSPRTSRGEGWGEGLSPQARLAESPPPPAPPAAPSPHTGRGEPGPRRHPPTSPRKRGEVKRPSRHVKDPAPCSAEKSHLR